MILAIDPGTEQSGFVVYVPRDRSIHRAGVLPNEEVIKALRAGAICTEVAIETMQANYGTVGASTIETILWTGRFLEAWESREKRPPVIRVSRQQVKAHVCNGNTRATDAGVRQALIDKLGPVGVKKQPGPLYGVKSHAWAALAVAVTAAESGQRVRADPAGFEA